jgi:hypothetical protein
MRFFSSSSSSEFSRFSIIISVLLMYFFLYQLIALFTICAEKYKNIKVRAVIARKCNNTQEAASVALPAGAGGAAPRRKQFFSQLSKNW